MRDNCLYIKCLLFGTLDKCHIAHSLTFQLLVLSIDKGMNARALELLDYCR